MRNGRKLWRTEKVEYLGHFVSSRGKLIQRVCEPIKFLETESCKDVDNSKLSIEIKSKVKQAKVLYTADRRG